MRVGSLFSGIGGLELGLERAGMKVVWQVENDPYARRVLEKHWPDVPKHNDVRTVHSFGHGDCVHCLDPVDLICGGFPCQPFSTASRGRRVAEDLWPEMCRVVRELGPRFVVAENVSLSAIETAAGDLTDLGYTCGVISVSAAVVGAPHERPRWFLVADAYGKGKPLGAEHGEVACLPDVADVAAWSAEPDTVGMDDGLPHRVDRLRCLGNAVVPQVAEHVGRLILAAS